MGRPFAVPSKIWLGVRDELIAVAMAWGAYRSARDDELKAEADMLLACAEKELEHKLRAYSLDELTCTQRHLRCCQKGTPHVVVEQPAA